MEQKSFKGAKIC